MEGYTEYEVEKLHEQYWNLYEKEGFFFMGAMDVYVPMMVFWAGVSYVGKTALTVLEHFICRLIQEEIHELKDIAFVLGINERLIEKAAEQLIKSGILEKCMVSKESKKGRAGRMRGSLAESIEYYLTTDGRELYLKNQKISVEREQIRSVFNMVSGNLEEEVNRQLVQQIPEGYLTLDAYYLLQIDDVEIEINPADVRMEVFRASGAGGQHVNKTSSAVRLIHEPTGIVAECQTERSQLQNREYAMRLLKSRLYEQEKAKQDAELANERKSQVGTGDRSEKIRTYNYPQGRITDHRIGMSIYQMENFLNGNIDEMVDNLIAADRAEKLKGEE